MTTRRRIGRAIQVDRRREKLRTERVAPVTGRVTGAEPDGRLNVVVYGRDCVSTGTIDSRAEGDDLTFSRLARTDGPAAAPGQTSFGSGLEFPPMPVVTAVEPDVWPQASTLDVVATGYDLTEVADLALFLGEPFQGQPFPHVTVAEYWPGFEVEPTGDPEIDGPPNPEKLLMRVDVATASDTFNERGAGAVDNTAGRTDEEGAPLPPRSRTDDLFELGEALPNITAMDIVWGDTNVFEITATGTKLDGIDTVEINHPDEPATPFEEFCTVAVLASTSTSLALQVTKGDEFPSTSGRIEEDAVPSSLRWLHTPQAVEFGTGGLQYTSEDVWVCHPPVRPIESWNVFPLEWESGGVAIPPGLYATPQPFDPAQPGRVGLPGRAFPIPGGVLDIASVYSPPGGAPPWYHGIMDARWVGGPEGLIIFAQRGDALPDGHATGGNYGTGSGVGWQAFEAVTGVLHPPVIFPSENRLLGPVYDGGTIAGVTWRQGLGGQFVSSNVIGSNLVVGTRVNGSRVAGTAPHEAMCGKDTFIVCTAYPASGFVPVDIQTWNGGGRTIAPYSSGSGQADRLGTNWKTQNRASCGAPGSVRVVELAGTARAMVSTVSSDADQWPNAGVTAGPDLNELDFGAFGARFGCVLTGVPASAGKVWISSVDDGGPGGYPQATSATSVSNLQPTPQANDKLGNVAFELLPQSIMVYPPDILPDGAL